MSESQSKTAINIISGKPPLDESYYNPDDEELTFYKSQTGIADDQALKDHITRIQTDAYETVYPYPCIRRFAFMRLKISRLPAYPKLLRLGKEREGAIFLDIGCCFGNDVRKAIADGYPRENCIASDLESDFWKLGHRLFNTDPETFPVPFIPGDAFDPNFIQSEPPFYSLLESPAPQLSRLTTLTPLLGRVSAIHASSLFHLFDEAKQLQLARALAGLLSPQPGSLVFGMHGGRQEKGFETEQGVPGQTGTYMFCHCPDSWTELWDGVVFEKGTVRVEAELKQIERRDIKAEPGTKFYALLWSVTRV
ncbi:uncharacterized protein B0H18DRAFT_1016496 [Fomitopsis serialis]|uniref:uncharacterized protein n=1 Tax=Fomitopsis serialis TaxID=139415 RepID=UPI002008B561|nr:uncharacterized protein B0H18DRAFT_1016496 [Neoantrodia serialis]KAH9922698.1 hypothetical protein B0H18DRAFT_1016496 [Neoantrodia serialis]